MARTRTVQTAEKATSDPLPDGSGLNGRRSDVHTSNSKSDCERKIGASDGRNNRSAAVPSPAASTRADGAIAPTNRTAVTSNFWSARKPSPARNDGFPAASVAGHYSDIRQDRPSLGRNYDGHGRFRSAVARKPSPERENRPPPLDGYRRAQQQGRQHGGYASRARGGWNDPRGSQHNFGRGGQHSSRVHWEPPKRRHDTSFPRGDYELTPGEYQHRQRDDENWGRKRDWTRKNDRPFHHQRHRPNNNNCHYPRERHNKCQKRIHRPSHSSNNKRDSHNSTGRHCSSSNQRHEQPRNNQEIQALTLQVAKLKKEVEKMKEAKNERDVFPDTPMNLATQSPIVQAGLNEVADVASPLDLMLPCDAFPGNDRDTDTTIDFQNDAKGQAVSSASLTCNITTVKDCGESCYDASTDEDITFANNGEEDTSSDAGGNNAENGEDINDNQSSNISNYDDSDQDSVDLVLRQDYDFHGKIAFCCQNCRCHGTSQAKYYHIRNNCGNSGSVKPGNTRLYHKGCCHGDKKADEDFLSPMVKAIEKSFSMKKRTSRLDTYQNIKKAYISAKREESKFENEEFNEASDNAIYMSPVYEKCCSNFQQRQKDRTSPLRVLDLFSGIGSGAVALKRLKLPIKTMVHVEHDPVAIEVCKANHQDEEINHQYIETFEEVYGISNEADDVIVKRLVRKWGPFDLVLAGSPCQNYSGLNANKDANSENAQYLLKVGRLIQKLDELQMGGYNANENVLFLSENVVFRDHDKVDQSYGGLPPVRLDAKDFGPCKRNRYYWTNIRLSSSSKIKDVASGVSIDGFLDDGYKAVARLLQDEDEQNMPVKSNSFLASLSRIDDDRMLKYKLISASGQNTGTKYQIETYSIAEREKCMGLPTGYVETAVGRLFRELTQGAFIQPETSDEGKSYRDFLLREFWHYRKKCNFKFMTNSEPPFFQLALSSPLEGKAKLAFYTEKQYCKHLIGNGWSIPVVEYLLGSLTELFADDELLAYDQYSTPYPWPYISL